AELEPEECAGQIAEEGRAEAYAGEVVDFGLDEEGERQPLIVQLEHHGGGGERGVEEDGGAPAARAGPRDGGGGVEGSAPGGELPDLIGSGVGPFAGGKREEAKTVEGQQPGVGTDQIEGLEEEPVREKESLGLPQGRAGVFVKAAGEVGG